MFDSKFVVPLIPRYVAFAAPPSFGYMAGFTFAQFVYDPTSQSPLGLVTIAMFCGFISGDGRVIYVANVCRAHGRVHILTVTVLNLPRGLMQSLGSSQSCRHAFFIARYCLVRMCVFWLLDVEHADGSASFSSKRQVPR
ncbi:hypothetical protein JG688_00002813 [Phytophthora aleatoria]|uniref:Uncharacterized protein n=1 Tax=Phytophthora aleatoria TaxID=2496075 RepID=A0A8J5IU79_9STRA|nr:hypothetical protein JG688_00002813 [Phytophthora aleatoria]